ncbi:MAG: aldehyde ferredoxin oxidoreductase family protein [Candidatus Tectomicrobia bacterium]|nr:aldehyde ferredoxin oxidoreductase family protein [Candidatus Tectomicrobia bacterium]
MLGYQGKVLHIDLAARTTRREVDALSPENVIAFAVGPYTDTAVPSASRACIAAKSPLTDLFFDSTFGGSWPATLKRTGHDAIVLHGRASGPVYLVISEEGAAFRDASDLKGKWIRGTCEAVSSREGGADVIAIGPAGENAVRFAAMTHTWRKSRDGISGRGGMAAVLGSKNVKAIAVKGKARTEVADAKGLREYVNGTAEDVRKGTAALHKYGTPILVNMINKMGALGTRNLTTEMFENCQPISGEHMLENYLDKDTTCLKCPVACGKDYLMKGGDFGGLKWKMPEYESIFALGTMLGIGDAGALMRGNMLCDELGLDTVSAGVTLSLAFECYERGLLKKSDTGVDLRWGDGKTMLRILEDMAHRRGFGARLAEGGQRLAASIGGEAPNLLYAARGLELPAHSARALKGMSIGYATGTRGGSHHDTRPTLQYAADHDNTSPEGKPLFAIRTQNFTAMGDSITQCRFTAERGYGAMINDKYAAMLNMITGWDATAEELERTGERIVNLERAFQVREGVDRTRDMLPHRVMHEPIPEGPHKGMHCPPEELEAMKDEYYRLRGWSGRGVPSAATLKRLGLEDVAERIGANGAGR